ncbi:MAG: hypothetical protein HQL20_06660 [Candidatus Omnitrophica bacterium]|nr:hypothetical protein [Candidatus Omnitrophota bacterium]
MIIQLNRSTVRASLGVLALLAVVLVFAGDLNAQAVPAGCALMPRQKGLVVGGYTGTARNADWTIWNDGNTTCRYPWGEAVCPADTTRPAYLACPADSKSRATSHADGYLSPMGPESIAAGEAIFYQCITQ